MLKRVLTFAMIIIAAVCASAQGQGSPLPLNPNVKSGKLPNGLSYYILHNEFPKERANFYIAQKVGSTLETPEQLGLAHFLEHMAFNGTKNYPGKNMLNYLQSKGIRFGADINAYTGFDETVYNIDNIPTTDKALMDSVLLVLSDWSNALLLEEDEINAERGVIEEEWRSRNDADFRMYEKILPSLYQEYQYQQMPIGKMEVVRNFKPKALRDYYEKWYRPDQQGIVIVGDFDAAEMEKKVIDLFSKIEAPVNPAERTYPNVSDNEKPIFTYFEDPELQYPMVRMYFKYDKIPFEMRNTAEAYVEDVVKNLIATMINNRLNEYSQKPECKYAYAGVNFGDYFIAKTKGGFMIICIAKDNVQEAFNEALAIVTRACKTGFTDSELVRARDEMLANYEKLYNERNNSKTETLARELIRHFVDNEPTPGIETEYNMVKQFLPMIPVQALNQGAAQLLTPENQVFIVSQPKKEGMAIVTEEGFVGEADKVLNAQYEAYVDEVITEPLIAKLPAKGKIKAQAQGKFETTEFELSNGVKVIVKPTDFKADEIRFEAFAPGGRRSLPETKALDAKVAELVFGLSKFGPFDYNKLQKYMAGKNADLNYSVANTVYTLSGSSSVKDLPVFMELLYTAFTALGSDPETFSAQMSQYEAMLKNQDSNPQVIFNNRFVKDRYNGNQLFTRLTYKDIPNINYASALDFVKGTLANAADYTMIFVGNVDIETLKPLLEQYVATLPANSKNKGVVKDITSIAEAGGDRVDAWNQPMQTPSTMVANSITGNNIAINVENDVKVGLLGEILSNVFTETLREEEGGTYSPYAVSFLSPASKQWTLIYVFQTNAAQQDKLQKLAYENLNKLINGGAKEEDFQKVKNAALKQYEINVRTNGYWVNNLVTYNNSAVDMITNNRAAIENLTLADFNAFLKQFNTKQNRLQVVMTGVEAAK